MNKRRHYFLKLGIRNYLFDFFLKKSITPHLIIGHGRWTTDEYLNNKHLTSERLTKDDLKFINRVAKQIKDFMESRDNRKDVYFWIFHEERIFSLQAVSEISDLFNYENPQFMNFCNKIEKWEGDKSMNKKDSDKFNLWSDAKLCKAEFVKGFEHGINSHEVIHKFASINAHQGYNRRTIAEIKDEDAAIADAILDYVAEKKVAPSPESFDEKIHYLSPLQLETLVFLTTYEMGYLPAGYRGGTGKSYDILLNNTNQPFNHISDRFRGINYISVKLKEDQAVKALLEKEEDNSDIDTIYIFSDRVKSKPSKKYDESRVIDVKEMISYLDDTGKKKIEKWINAQIELIPFKPII